MMQALRRLPFVGREEEIGRIVQLFSEVIEADSLSAIWIHGQAGIGKSRLVEQALIDLENAGATIVHTRLRPDLDSSPIPLLAYLINNSATFSTLIPHTVTDNLVSVSTALRRLARLRPLTVVLEDLHLLREENIREFTMLLHAIADEPIYLICTTRPQGYAAHGAILPYLVDTVTLSPLSVESLQRLLTDCQIDADIPAVTGTLYRVTRGIPLVVRAALADLLRQHSDEITPGGEEGRELRTERLRSIIRNRAENSISSLEAGLTADLNDEEMDVARKLALLGEVFSRKGARALCGEAEEIIERLLEKEVLSYHSAIDAPLYGYAEEVPLSFTHTLLHEFFLDHTLPDGDLYHLVEANPAIYSTIPLLRLASLRFTVEEEEKAEKLYDYLCGICQKTHYGKRYRSVVILHQALYRFVEHHRSVFGKEKGKTYLLAALKLTVSLLGTGHPFSDEYERALSLYLELTENPENIDTARHRLTGLAYLLPTRMDQIMQSLVERLDEIDALVLRYPALPTTPEYASVLASLAALLRPNCNEKLIERIEGYLPHIAIPDVYATGEGERVGIHFLVNMLPLFATAEQLKHRQELAQKLSAHIHSETVPPGIGSYFHYLKDSGNLREARRVLIEHQNDSPPYSRYFNMANHLIFIESALGRPLEQTEQAIRQITQEARQIFGSTQPDSPHSIAEIGLAFTVVSIGQIRDQFQWARGLALDICSEDARVRELLLSEHLFHPSEEHLGKLHPDRFFFDELEPLVRAMAKEEAVSLPDFEEMLSAIFSSPVVHFRQLLKIRAAIALAEIADIAGSELTLAEAIAPRIADGLRRALAWCLDHEAVAAAPPLLQSARPYLPGKEHQEISRKVESMRKKLAGEFKWDEEPRGEQTSMLTMLGSIAFTDSKGDTQRIQGARAKQILGVMVASQLNGAPLTPAMFREIAVSPWIDQNDSANTVRVTISRLRGMLGKDAILTSRTAAPRLNTDLIHVDLMVICDHIERAQQAAEGLRPLKAKQELRKAIELFQSDPAYPALYGSYFDAARMEFETRVRKGFMVVAKLLRSEKDYREGVDLLQKALELLPEDRELTTILIQLLDLSNNHLEAESLRYQSERREVVEQKG